MSNRVLRVPRVVSSITVLLVAACGGGGDPPGAGRRDALRAIVDRDAVWFDASSVPEPLSAAGLAGARVLLLGETHYVQEHQDFLVRLLPSLHAAGFRVLMQEDMHIAAWTGEEYVMQRSDELPREEAALNQTLLEGLRAFNAPLAEADRIHYAGFDMNHWRIFSAFARRFQDRFGPVPELDSLLATTPDSAEYEAALAQLPAKLGADEASLTATLGAARYAQLQGLVEVETRSLPLRRAMDGAVREHIIEDLVAAVLAEASPAAVAINTGAFHAQKERWSGPEHEPFGAWLVRTPEQYGGDPAALRSVAFLGAKGETQAHFYDTTTTHFDVTVDASEDDLARILAEQAAGRYAWLPFSDAMFANQGIAITWGDAPVVTPPAAQYDALVQYPEVSVLRSLSLVR